MKFMAFLLFGLLALPFAALTQDDYWLQKGLDEKDYAKKIGYFTKSIQTESDSGAAYFCRASARHEQGDNLGAIADYSKCIDIDPMDAGAYFNRGAEKQILGDLKGAVADFAKANELDPTNGNNICNTCLLYSLIEDYENALNCYQTCLGVFADKALIYNNIGCAYLGLEKYREALDNFDRCLELKPDFFFALLGKALVYHFTNDVVNEKIFIDRVKELKPALKEGLKGYEAFKKEGGYFSRKNDSAMREMFAR